MASRKEQKERARQERLEAERAATAQALTRRRLQLGGGVAVAVIVGVVIAIVAATSGGSGGSSHSGSGPRARVVTTSTASLGKLRPAPSPGALGPEGIPIPQAAPLASTAGKASGQSVDGIQCNSAEQTLFHVHTHLTIFVNGVARQIPYGIGIPGAQVSQSAQGPFVGTGNCFYWLHTHAPDGIIHIESPVQRTYSLGDFFDVWNQPLGPNQVGPAHGKVTAFYNGKRYTGNPRNIPIGRYVQIQLDIGTPLVAPEKVSFAGTGL